ncbi:putative pectate lyase [Rosellinia necatrix]|uniref:Putative pectate lyase n=1 Tax=Rosellinia necatrix TaxID=77044 RepID=A0A1W2TWD3_ROSNE|nr:putative pectate lyase [Rosellinia necatrix]
MARSLAAAAVILGLLSTSYAQQPIYAQCGGIGWSGGTTCVSGTTCTYLNDYYYQCLPPTTTLTTTTKVTTTTTTTKTTTTTSKTTSTTTSAATTTTGAGSPAPSASGFRVRLNPTNLRLVEDADWPAWTVPAATSASYVTKGVTFTLSVPSDTTLKGARYKLVQQKFVPSMGERMIGEGITTESTTGGAVTLSITGLSAGTHTLLSYHNAWDNLSSAASLKITVDGATAVSSLAQSIRVNNIWDAANSYVSFTVTSTSQVVKIVYTPSGGDKRAFLNGFEIDSADIDQQVGFPYPNHNDQHIDLAGATSIQANWKAPKAVSSPTYKVHLGTTSSTLTSVGSTTSTSFTFSGLNTNDYYYWRVDVVSGSTTYVGRVFLFRLAHLAFPGAEGWGRWARGGRGGKVVKVTSLADSTAAGTLRYALTVATGPRTIVFDIGGVITLTSRLTVSDSFITLAGQTAPGKGIAIQGWPLGLSGASDVIFQHIRVRPGKISGNTVDGMGMQGSNHCIFDRCSVGWTIDESFSSRSAFNITLQRTMISEPLNVAGHQNYPAGTAHGYAASIGGDVGSFHHNLIAHAEGRSWSLAGGLDDAATFSGRLDIRNNVVYNYGGRVTDGGAHQVNFVSNYYKPGAASGPSYDLQATYEDAAPGTQTYHCSGNSQLNVFTQDSTQVVSDGTGKTSSVACYAAISVPGGVSYQKFYSSAFFEPYVTTQTSTEAYKRVLGDSGAQQPVQDDHDKRIVRETVAGTYTYKGSASGKPGLIDDPADAGGLESFPTTSRASTWDANSDGIADWWDGSTSGAGYTALEGYLNFMAEPHAFVSPSKTVVVDISTMGAGFVSPTYTVSGPTKGTVTVASAKATYTAGSATGIDSFTVAIKDSQGSTWSRTVGVAIYAGAN